MLTVLVVCCIVTNCIGTCPKCFDQVNIYTNVAQVKQSLNNNATFVFTSAQSTMIYPDLITIEDCDENCKLQISTLDSSLINSDVIIKNKNNCNKSGRKAILKDPSSNLIQYVDNGRYAYVTNKVIEYLEKPSKRICVSVKQGPVQSLDFTFITQQISWQAEHELDVIQNEFITNVVIKNNANELFSMQSGTTLLTKDLDINILSNIAYSGYGSDQSSPKAMLFPVDDMTGVRKYTIDHPLSVPANGYLRFKLSEQENWSSVIFSKRSRSLYDSIFKGRPNQVVRFNATSFIPAGNINIKDDGWIIHRTSIPSISENEQYDINFGQNPDIAIFENVATISDKMSKNISFNTKISNFKAEKELIEYELYLIEGIIGQYTYSKRINIIEKQDNRILFNVRMKENEVKKFALDILVELPMILPMIPAN